MYKLHIFIIVELKVILKSWYLGDTSLFYMCQNKCSDAMIAMIVDLHLQQ